MADPVKPWWETGINPTPFGQPAPPPETPRLALARAMTGYANYQGNGGVLGLLYGALPDTARDRLSSAISLMGEMSPGAGVRDFLQSSGDLTRAFMNAQPGPMLTAAGGMMLGAAGAIPFGGVTDDVAKGVGKVVRSEADDAARAAGKVMKAGVRSESDDALRLAKAVAANQGDDAARGIRAYHGSPHSFDKFDMAKIGTGEGAQAYGHGLYFAGNESVARGYKTQLAKGFMMKDGSPLTQDYQRALEFVHPKFKDSGDIAGGIDDAIKRLTDQADFYRKTYGPGRNLYDSAIDRLREINPDSIKPSGHMYEVNLRVDPDKLLDWDKGGQQRWVNEVQKALIEAPGGSKGYAPPPGFDPHAIAAQNLKEKGIPGIKYLDQGSRGFTVDLSVNGKPYASNKFGTLAEAQQYAAAKKAEGFAADIAQKGTHNYVMFDPALIEILRKYGFIPGGLIGAMSVDQLLSQQQRGGGDT